MRYSFFRAPQANFSGRGAFFLLLVLLALFFAGGYLIFLALRFIFGQSLLLGILFIFLILPLLGRFLFFLFFILLPSLLAVLFLGKGDHRDEMTPPAKDDVIDVKYKIEK